MNFKDLQPMGGPKRVPEALQWLVCVAVLRGYDALPDGIALDLSGDRAKALRHVPVVFPEVEWEGDTILVRGTPAREFLEFYSHCCSGGRTPKPNRVRA